MTVRPNIWNDDGTSWLCHYTRAERAFGSILAERRLLMNPYRLMRDPLEAQPPFIKPVFSPDLSNDEFDLRLAAVVPVLQAARDRFRLLSFTQRSPVARSAAALDKMYSQPWVRARMWEQYAEAHYGVCLVFDQARLIEPLKESPLYRAEAVKYTATGYANSEATTKFDASDFRPEAAKAFMTSYIEAHADDFFFLKSDDWRAEHEYRILLESKQSINDLEFVEFADALRYVIVGARFPEWQIPSALAAVERLGDVELCRMTWQRGFPIPERIDPASS